MKNTIDKLANLSPTELLTYTLEDFTAVAKQLTFSEIINTFKVYRPLDRGNTKLHKSILSFSLLPVVTCNTRCKGCYDIKSLRYKSVMLKRIVNTLLACYAPHRNKLFQLIRKQISRSRTVKAIRIHVGGDFFSLAYAKKWNYLASQYSFLSFYTYTKTEYTPILTMGNCINVVRSKLADGSNNFAQKQIILAKQKRIPNSIICPATLRTTPDHFCGSRCKACQTKQNVLFVQH